MQLTPPYEKFAYAYDRMMRNVNYLRWRDYIVSTFNHYDCVPETILDLGCGTGALTILLAAQGYSMTGVDRANGMLQIAREKSIEKNVQIKFCQADMVDFQLEQQYDAIICTYDSINYVCSENELCVMFENISKHLTSEGLFIFDVTTERNIVEHFHNKTFAANHQDYTYIWKNNYLYQTKMCQTFLTFFIREGDLFRRYEEVHQQRIYEVDTINQLLKRAGYKMLSAFDMWTFSRWNRNSDRINFTAKLT